MQRPLNVRHIHAMFCCFLSASAIPFASATAEPVELRITVPANAVTEDLRVGVRGDTPPLEWDRSLYLTDRDRDGVYTGTIDFPDEAGIVGYKVVLESGTRLPVWEDGANRLLFPGRMRLDERAFGEIQAELPALTVPEEQLREDIATLLRGLEALHPGLTLHNTQEEWDAIRSRLLMRAADLAERFDDAIPVTDVYLIVARSVAAIRDGHTQVSMFNQGAYLESTLYARADRVPFTFRLLGDRMVVTADATEKGLLPPGTEILALDGRPVTRLIPMLMPYASADGANDAKRIKQFEVSSLPAPAERFDVIYSLLFQPEGDLSLRVRTHSGAESEFDVPRLSASARSARLLERDPTRPRSSGDLLQFRLLPDGTGYLKISSFATFNMDRDYDAWLTGAFRSLREQGTERLVVDLRNNAGGMDDAAGNLLAHLIEEPARLTFWNGVTAYDRVPDAVRPHVRSWDTSFLDLTDTVVPDGEGGFRLPERPRRTLEPAPDAFRGEVAVLIDAEASSATFYLAQQIRQTGAAMLVGQVTGGSLKGLNAGQMAFLTLPNTGIVVDVPLFGSRPATPGPDRGVIPDLVVQQDADALIAGRDIELEAALTALRGENATPD